MGRRRSILSLWQLGPYAGRKSGFVRLERSRRKEPTAQERATLGFLVSTPEKIYIYIHQLLHKMLRVSRYKNISEREAESPQLYIPFGAISPWHTLSAINNDKVAVSEGSNASLAGFQLGKHPATSAWVARDVDVNTEDKDGFEYPPLTPWLSGLAYKLLYRRNTWIPRRVSKENGELWSVLRQNDCKKGHVVTIFFKTLCWWGQYLPYGGALESSRDTVLAP